MTERIQEKKAEEDAAYISSLFKNIFRNLRNIYDEDDSESRLLNYSDTIELAKKLTNSYIHKGFIKDAQKE